MRVSNLKFHSVKRHQQNWVKSMMMFIFFIYSFPSLAQEIRIKYGASPCFGYDCSVRLGMQIMTKDGRIIQTKGYLNGTLPWWKLKVSVAGGKFKKGILTIGGMSDVVDSSKVILTVEYKDEGIKQVIPIELLFNNHIIAHFKPRDAKSGGMKFNFFERLLQLFGIERCASSGTNGKNGKNGPHLIVDLQKMTIKNNIILKTTIKNEEQVFESFIDPYLGSIYISSEGGNGGDGGDGESINNGCGGNGGDGGNGGWGGVIDVYVNDETRAYLHAFHFSNEGGSGGKGGKGGPNGQNGQDGLAGNKVSPVTILNHK
jgi:hypothetical protein